MSTMVMSLVWPMQMPPSPKAVLVSLADNANDEGVCWPSITRIGMRTCLGRTAVIDALRWLEDEKLLRVERTGGIRNRYTLTVQGIEAYPAPRASSGVGELAQPVRQADGSVSATSPAGERDQSATRTGPVRQADPNRKEPSVTAKKAKTPKIAEQLPDPPEWLDREAWDGFVEMRARIKHPMTHRAAVLVLRELETFRREGVDPVAALDKSTRNGWRDVFRPKPEDQRAISHSPHSFPESKTFGGLRRLQLTKGGDYGHE